MSGSMLGDDPQKTARDLQGALEGMTAQLGQVKASLRRGKRVIAVIVVSLLIDAAVTIGVGIAVDQAGNASAKANATVAQLHSTQVNACRAGNSTRAEEVALWVHLGALSAPPPHLTKAQLAANQRKIAQLLTYVRTVFKPRDCQKVYAISGPGR